MIQVVLKQNKEMQNAYSWGAGSCPKGDFVLNSCQNTLKSVEFLKKLITLQHQLIKISKSKVPKGKKLFSRTTNIIR